MTETTTAPTAEQVTEAVAALTPKGRETMKAVGNWSGSFFDEGLTVGSGIWGECFMNESGHKSAGVINRLRDLDLFNTTPDEDGIWFYLTALGVAVAQYLNEIKEINSMTETTTAKPAAKKATAKKAAAAPATKGRAYKTPKGYEVKWQHGGHDLLKKADAAVKGPEWFTACNEHGDLHEAKTAKEAESFGVLKVRATWCKGDHKATAKKADAAPAAPAAHPLVEAVKAHATANYDKGGWDILVETMSDEDILKVIGKARTEAGAIKKAAAHVGVTDAVRADIASA